MAKLAKIAKLVKLAKTAKLVKLAKIAKLVKLAKIAKLVKLVKLAKFEDSICTLDVPYLDSIIFRDPASLQDSV